MTKNGHMRDAIQLSVTILVAGTLALFIFGAAVWWFSKFPSGCDEACRQQRARQWEWHNRTR